MRQDGLIRHIGLSNVSADQLRSALAITDIAAVTVHYNVAVRLGAAVRQVAQEAASSSPPGTRAPSPEATRAGRSTLRSIRSPRSTTLLLGRSPSPGSCTAPSRRCPSPVPPAPSTSRRTSPPLHISLTPDEVDAITALRPKKSEIDRRGPTAFRRSRAALIGAQDGRKLARAEQTTRVRILAHDSRVD